jgi:hypothetical protein
MSAGRLSPDGQRLFSVSDLFLVDKTAYTAAGLIGFGPWHGCQAGGGRVDGALFFDMAWDPQDRFVATASQMVPSVYGITAPRNTSPLSQKKTFLINSHVPDGNKLLTTSLCVRFTPTFAVRRPRLLTFAEHPSAATSLLRRMAGQRSQLVPILMTSCSGTSPPARYDSG